MMIKRDVNIAIVFFIVGLIIGGLLLNDPPLGRISASPEKITEEALISEITEKQKKVRAYTGKTHKQDFIYNVDILDSAEGSGYRTTMYKMDRNGNILRKFIYKGVRESDSTEWEVYKRTSATRTNELNDVF